MHKIVEKTNASSGSGISLKEYSRRLSEFVIEQMQQTSSFMKKESMYLELINKNKKYKRAFNILQRRNEIVRIITMSDLPRYKKY